MPTRFLPSVSKPVAGLLLVLLAPLALAQQGASGLSDSERAKRDANKVLSFIKFHAVRAPRAAAPVAAPAAAVAAVAPAQVAPRPRAVPAAARESDGLQAAALDQAAVHKTTAGMAAAALPSERPGISVPPVSEPQPQGQAVELPQPQPSPAPVEPAPAPEPEAEDLVELKLIEHVQPELPRGNGLRDGTVRVRFTVMPDGSVQKVTTNASAQRRLATAASRAVQQWRFEAIQEATEVEVDVDFRFD